MIPILILAAGQSSRMGGRDKLLEDVGGMPLLRQQVQVALSTGHPVYVALPPKADARRTVIKDLAVTVIDAPDAHEGMSATMRNAVSALPQAEGFMITLGDLVAIEASDFEAVFAARQADRDCLIWRGVTEDGKPGHPILFDASLRACFDALAGDDGAAAVVQSHRAQTCLVPLAGDRARFDLDTPEEWAAWRKSSL